MKFNAISSSSFFYLLWTCGFQCFSTQFVCKSFDHSVPFSLVMVWGGISLNIKMVSCSKKNTAKTKLTRMHTRREKKTKMKNKTFTINVSPSELFICMYSVHCVHSSAIYNSAHFTKRISISLFKRPEQEHI